MWKKISFFLSILTVFFLCFVSTTYAVSKKYTLTWDANSEPDLKGYRIYVGTVSRQYTMVFELGLVTVYDGTIQVPDDTVTTFYFAVTAIDTSLLESDYSNEVFKKYDTRIPPTAPKNLKWYERVIAWIKQHWKIWS